MAEASSSNSSQPSPKLKDDFECAVCLQTCIHPAQLPCGHIFCFLCVKGIANQSKKCAMCRQEIPRDFIEQPTLLQCNLNLGHEKCFDEEYQWFYEGRNGWWQYDERTGKEIEAAYKAGDRACELLIAGSLYVIDLENMLQFRRNDSSRRRNIKRDCASIPKKGIAGLRTQSGQNENHIVHHSAEIQDNRTEDILPPTPTNTPQSYSSERQSSEEDLIERMQALQVDPNLLHNQRHTNNSDQETNCTAQRRSE